MLEVSFSRCISKILIRTEPFYDGPVEAVFQYDSGTKRKVLTLREDKNHRIDNWRVFCLRDMKASRLDQYPQNLIYVYFLHLGTKTRVEMNAITANSVIIDRGHLKHPSMI